MNIPVFGTKKTLKALRSLGFDIETKKGKGSHVIAKHPSKRPQDLTIQRPFITIPNRKEFFTSARAGFVKQAMLFGFTREEVLEALFGKK